MKKRFRGIQLLSCPSLWDIIVPEFIESPFPLTVFQLQSIVECSGQLRKSDWTPSNPAETANYPIWKHRLQAVLAGMKKNGDLWHDPATHTYGLTFKHY